MAMKVRYTVLDGEVVSEDRDGVVRDYLPDPLGSTLALLDNTQTKTDTFQYWPNGEVASRTGTTATPLQFVGTKSYYRDNASRTYVGARVLDTRATRWMTQDPIGFKGGDWNLYRYVRNRPIVVIDPSGYYPPPYTKCSEIDNIFPPPTRDCPRKKELQDACKRACDDVRPKGSEPGSGLKMLKCCCSADKNNPTVVAICEGNIEAIPGVEKPKPGNIDICLIQCQFYFGTAFLVCYDECLRKRPVKTR